MITRFYEKMPTMECLQGDTLGVFEVHVEASSLENCTMQMILEDKKKLGMTAKVKDCTAIEGGFSVQLTSADTANLHGVYDLHFRLRMADGMIYRKLSGVLIVIPTVQGS